MNLSGDQLKELVSHEEFVYEDVESKVHFFKENPLGRVDKHKMSMMVLDGVTQRAVEQLSRKNEPPVACKKGCDSCCKSMEIFVNEIEVLRIVRHINMSDEKNLLIDQIKNAIPTKNGSGNPKIKCSMLSPHGECLVHDSRPSTCIFYLSTNVKECERYANFGGQAPKIPVYGFIALQAVTDIIHPLFLTRSQPIYEINSILNRIYGCSIRLESWSKSKPTTESDLVINKNVLSKLSIV